MSALLRSLLLAVLLLSGWGMASAHELTMGEMTMREVKPGEFLWQWTASGARPASDELTPVWPAQCVISELGTLQCGTQGLAGTLHMDGVGDRYSAAVVRIVWLDGQTTVLTLTQRRPDARLFGSADDKRGGWEIARVYTALGVEHILSGIDHLAFVIALLFLVGFNRRLLLTITAFTVAHSLTLALSAMGWLTLRPPPVEATIALSIMLVAGEALDKRQTISRQWPAVVAFLFGLVHGLGFAGALSEIGLPQKNLLVALLTFNVGVEIGQLLVIGAAFLIWRALRFTPMAAPLRTPALYAIGGVAAFWSLQRIAAMVAA
jgi:hydrogenase/urease accessory protein HupE